MSNSSLAMIALLPNPEGKDRGREAVLLHNAGVAAVDLDGHWLADAQGRRTDLAGQLEAGGERAWVLDGQGAVLTNDGGHIELRNAEGAVHAITYGRASSGQWLAVPPPQAAPGEGWCVELLPELRTDGSPMPVLGRPSGGALAFNVRDYLAALREMKWEPGDVLTVGFMPGEGHEVVRERVEEVAREWSDHANIAFEFVGDARSAPADEVPTIRVGFRPGPVYSKLGRDCERVAAHLRTMNLGTLTTVTNWTKLRRTVLHEFGHALGLIHEHQQPAAAIPWDEDKVFEVFRAAPFGWDRNRIERNILDRYAIGTTQFSAFDPSSIMLYPIPGSVTGGAFESSWNNELSPRDTSYVEELYPPDKAEARTLPVDGAPVDVRFDKDAPTRRFILDIADRNRYAVQTEGALDTLLDIRREGSAEVLRENDESAAAPGSNARLELELEPGRYVVRAWLYYPGAIGVARIFARRLTS